MLNTAALMVKLFALTMLLGMGSVFASLPPLPGAPDRDHMPNYLSKQASMFLVEIQQETGKLLAEIQKETAELRPRAYTRRTFPSDPDDGEQRRHSFWIEPRTTSARLENELPSCKICVCSYFRGSSKRSLS